MILSSLVGVWSLSKQALMQTWQAAELAITYLGFVVIMSFLVSFCESLRDQNCEWVWQIVPFAPQNKQINQNRVKTTAGYVKI